ncbi:MAG: Hsp20/alpha crystallin family protein [Solirubrobacterales bacterium]|nr:Hsp20/alpha crystallin family protein [Solirubrobacterales bacterium]
MPTDRDIFANFERMRREMDELFGDAFGRTGLARRGRGFSPPVDVFYLDSPPRAVVKVDLAGIDPSELSLEVQGRELIIAGLRRPTESQEGRVYQQLEIEHGGFRRVIELGADVSGEDARATYEDGILRVELPLQAPRRAAARSVPVETSGGGRGSRGGVER